MIDETPEQAACRIAAPVLRNGFELSATHCYRSADGRPLYWRLRCTHPERPKWMRPMHLRDGRYVVGEPPAPPTGKVLYRLPELLHADAAQPVWIVEGEACAEALAEVGLVATTSGGAASAAAADWTPLRGRRVRLWPDHDPAGASYADEVFKRLQPLGCSTERLDPVALGLPDKGDCVDWRRAHPAATAADIEGLPRVLPKQESTEALRVILTRGCDVEPRAVEWLWNGYLAAGKFHLLGGAPGTGKTTITLALAATVTRGGYWPDGTPALKGDVVIWSGEDDHADTLNPRLRAAGADMERVHVVSGVVEAGKKYPFDPAHDIEDLRVALTTMSGVRLVIIDPLVAMIPGDSHKNAEVRRGLQPLVDLASNMSCAVLGVTHFSKGTGGRDPLERITGSVAFGALARVVMVVAQQEGRPGERVLVRAKTNIGPNGGGFVYRLDQTKLEGYVGVESSKVVWGEAIEGTARELLAVSDLACEDRTATEEAKEWLASVLEAGAVAAKQVIAMARQYGFSEKVLRSAREALGVHTKRIGWGSQGIWEWYLPVAIDALRTEGKPNPLKTTIACEDPYEEPTNGSD